MKSIYDIEKYWLKDSDIRTQDLSAASLNIPRLHAKYYALLIREEDEKRKLLSAEKEMRDILEKYFNRTLTIEELEEYGLGSLPDKKILKDQIKTHVDLHPDMTELLIHIAEQNAKIEYLKSIIQQISNMSFHIRNAIEYEKFRNGEH